MSPKSASADGGLSENDKSANSNKPHSEYRRQIVWRNVILFAYLHAAALYGLYLAITSAFYLTVIFAYVLHVLGALGITAGAHRLWSHRSYKAKLPLRIILMIMETLAFQNSIHEWARDHRVHHKFSETDADPHNAKRGFFFSHIGWLLVRKHPDVIQKGKLIDLSDLDRDPVVSFQKKYYLLLMLSICFIIPTCIPVYVWGETWSNSFFVATLLRYTCTLNVTWLVNSAAHIFGSKPFDKNISPSQNVFVSIGALGEGWHNYHHVFPWDYKTAELGSYMGNISTLVLDTMAKIGWAYDMKTVSPNVVISRAKRTGDGTYKRNKNYEHHHGGHDGEEVWGWDDKDLEPEIKKQALVINGEDSDMKEE